jgi:hypothetical protein
VGLVERSCEHGHGVACTTGGEQSRAKLVGGVGPQMSRAFDVRCSQLAECRLPLLWCVMWAAGGEFCVEDGVPDLLDSRWCVGLPGLGEDVAGVRPRGPRALFNGDDRTGEGVQRRPRRVGVHARTGLLHGGEHG